VLGAPMRGRPLLIYNAAQKRSLGALCAREKALYDLIRTLVEVELNYLLIYKMCMTLTFAIQKLRQYMQAHTMYIISKADLLMYVLSKPILNGRLVMWAAILGQYDLVPVS